MVRCFLLTLVLLMTGCYTKAGDRSQEDMSRKSYCQERGYADWFEELCGYDQSHRCFRCVSENGRLVPFIGPHR